MPDLKIAETVANAIKEDLGSGDLSANLITDDHQISAQVISREAAVICGIAWFEEVFRQIDATVDVKWRVTDGMMITPGQLLCVIHGKAKSLLTGERTALNFLQMLSGTATATHNYTQLLTGTAAKILDTRKTIPGLRAAQKYAVRCGGGHNHRIGLYDAILIKENHIAACGSIAAAVEQARLQSPQVLIDNVLIEVEVETLEQLQQALDLGVKRILLDNFNMDALRAAVILNQHRAELEVSGGITKENIREIAETGVNFISVGALTKHVHAIDLSMRVV